MKLQMALYQNLAYKLNFQFRAFILHYVCFGVAVFVHFFLLEDVLDRSYVVHHRYAVAPVGHLAGLHDVDVLGLLRAELLLVA